MAAGGDASSSRRAAPLTAGRGLARVERERCCGRDGAARRCTSHGSAFVRPLRRRLCSPLALPPVLWRSGLRSCSAVVRAAVEAWQTVGPPHFANLAQEDVGELVVTSRLVPQYVCLYCFVFWFAFGLFCVTISFVQLRFDVRDAPSYDVHHISLSYQHRSPLSMLLVSCILHSSCVFRPSYSLLSSPHSCVRGIVPRHSGFRLVPPCRLHLAVRGDQ